MQVNNTYSLKAILQSDLDPTLCKLMLHEIKSPLLEHSFQLTTDDENNSGSFSIANEQENERQQPRNVKHSNAKYNKQNSNPNQVRRMDKKLEQISVTHSQYETSKYQPSRRQQYSSTPNRNNQSQDISPIHTRTEKYNSQNNPQFILNQTSNDPYLVSPLQLPQSPTNDQVENFIKKVQSQIKQDQQNHVARWCGEVFNPANAFEREVIFNDRFVRRKIFEKKNKHEYRQESRVNNSPQNCYFNFRESINKLRHIDQNEVAEFIQLVSKILQLLKKTDSPRKNLGQNEARINKLLISQNPVDYQTKETISNKNKIINRLRVNKMSQVINKISNFERNQQGTSNYSAENPHIESDIAKVLQYYSQIQDVIEDYVSKPSCVVVLHKIYNLLYEHEINSNLCNPKQKDDRNINSSNATPHSPISTLRTKKGSNKTNEDAQIQVRRERNDRNIQQPVPSYPYKQSLRQKIQKLFLSLRIDPGLFKNLGDLDYIWSELNSKGAYSPTSGYNYKANKQKFIGELCKNDLLIHQSIKGITQLEIQKKLTSQGFRRNIQQFQP